MNLRVGYVVRETRNIRRSGVVVRAPLVEYGPQWVDVAFFGETHKDKPHRFYKSLDAEFCYSRDLRSNFINTRDWGYIHADGIAFVKSTTMQVGSLVKYSHSAIQNSNGREGAHLCTWNEIQYRTEDSGIIVSKDNVWRQSRDATCTIQFGNVAHRGVLCHDLERVA